MLTLHSDRTLSRHTLCLLLAWWVYRLDAPSLGSIGIRRNILLDRSRSDYNQPHAASTAAAAMDALRGIVERLDATRSPSAIGSRLRTVTTTPVQLRWSAQQQATVHIPCQSQDNHAFSRLSDTKSGTGARLNGDVCYSCVFLR